MWAPYPWFFFSKSTYLHICQGLLFILNLPNKLKINMSKSGNAFFHCRNLFLFPLVLFHLIVFQFYSCLAILIIISYVEFEFFILHTRMMLVQTPLRKSTMCDTTTLVCIQTSLMSLLATHKPPSLPIPLTNLLIP